MTRTGPVAPGTLPRDMSGRYRDLLADVEQADFPGTMQNTARRMDQWILDYLDRTTPTGEDLPLAGLFSHVSRFNARITSRIIQDAITTLETREHLTPPLPFCWISMGSDARGEQVIRTDQDNALIYADPPPGQSKTADIYFNALAGLVTQGLDRFGFTLCPGDVMATNPEWRRPLNRWLAGLDQWVGSTDPMAVRKLTILLDFKAVFGDNRLAAMLQTRVFKNFETHGSASHFLARDDQLFAPPKTWFNRIKTRRNGQCRRCFNLKTQAVAHLVNAARLFAVNHGIQVPATLGRLERLWEDRVITGQEYREISRAFVFLTRMKLTAHLTRAQTGPESKLPNNCIDISRLAPEPLKQLGHALDAVTRFQKKAATTYNQAWMNFFN